MHPHADNRPIAPELVARKLSQVRNFEQPEVAAEIEAQPRLCEVLWFLQWVSMPANYPGGLKRFCHELLAESADMLGAAVMHADGRQTYSINEAREIVASLPISALAFTGIGEDPADAVYLGRFDVFADLGELEQRERRQARDKAAADRSEAVARLTPQKMLEDCAQAASERLQQHLRALCERPEVCFTRDEKPDKYEVVRNGAPWYFPRVAEAILRLMDRRAAAVASRIAETEVSKAVFTWLGKASRTGRAVRIEGNSRFGKTEAVRAWCAMNPGRARLVETPAAQAESDFLRAVAKALGIELGPKQRGGQLREEIDYVLASSGLMLVFDEAQFIFPAKFTRNTSPARLDWIRRAVLDAGLPAAFIATPQSYDGAKNRFVRATGHVVQQFEERLLKTVKLPETVAAEDLRAIAAIHFPGMPSQYLEYVVRAAVATERNYVSDISKIADLARDYASEGGRTAPRMNDVRLAMADVLGTGLAAVSDAPQPPRIDHAEAMQAPRRDSAPARSLTPSSPLEASGRDSIFDLSEHREGSALAV